MATNDNGSASFEVLGTVKRVIRRPMTGQDRSEIDEQVHDLLDSSATLERQIDRAQKALSKLKKRKTAISSHMDKLHADWKAPTVEEIVDCRVVRTSTEIRIERNDGSEVIYARALTQEEHEALGTQLPGMPDARRVHHPELDADDKVETFEKASGEAKARRADLTKPMSFEDALAEVEDEEGADETDEKPKGGRGKKGKTRMKQTELFDGEGEGDSNATTH